MIEMTSSARFTWKPDKLSDVFTRAQIGCVIVCPAERESVAVA